MEGVSTMEDAKVFLRNHANSTLTKYLTTIRYGSVQTTIKYFGKQSGQQIGVVYKTNGEFDLIKIELDEDNIYFFTSKGKTKVRPTTV